MRVISVGPGGVLEQATVPSALPDQGFIWLALDRDELHSRLAEVQQWLQTLCGTQLVDLHVSDLLNAQLPSRYDYTAQYDVLVFRRLATGTAQPDAPRGGPPILRRVDTSPIGFALFERVLLSVHPAQCAVRESLATRLLSAAPTDARPALARSAPPSAADLMLRLASQVVDAYLDLRRELTRQLDHWQTELLHPRARFNQWDRLLQARLALHQLDEICEDQRNALQGWLGSLESAPVADRAARKEHELLKVRARDVLEHIERVVHHVRRLEHSAETTVQMHFSAQGNRTNDIMRTLTVLTAIFLPLNLITGIFGMNFEFIPLLHRQGGFWWALGGMAGVAVTLVLVFWRKRYLERSGR